VFEDIIQKDNQSKSDDEVMQKARKDILEGKITIDDFKDIIKKYGNCERLTVNKYWSIPYILDEDYEDVIDTGMVARTNSDDVQVGDLVSIMRCKEKKVKDNGEYKFKFEMEVGVIVND